MSTTKFANVKKSSLSCPVLASPSYGAIVTSVVQAGSCYGWTSGGVVCVAAGRQGYFTKIVHSLILMWARGRGSPEPSPILLSGGYLLTYADTASQFSLELKLKPKSFCQAQPQLNFNPIEAGIVLFSFNTATQPLSFFAPFWVNYKHISIIIIRNI